MCWDIAYDENHMSIRTDKDICLYIAILLLDMWKLRTSEVLLKATQQCQVKSKIQKPMLLSPKHIASIQICLARPLATLTVQECNISK